jgi:hypothetical protein
LTQSINDKIQDEFHMQICCIRANCQEFSQNDLISMVYLK